MHLQSRLSVLHLKWKQLPTLHKILSVAVLSLLLIVTLLQPSPAVARDGWDRLTRPKNQPLAGGIPLRVMFIGASMTLGEHSTGNLGYRKQVRDWLVSRGNPVNYVGQNRYGDFKDNDVQAFGAQPIKPTLDRLKEVVPQVQPNLFLINAGSSDCFQLDHWGPAYILQAMRALVDFLFEASPQATVIMSTIITSPRDVTERCVKSANAQIRQVATDLIREGKPVTMAEMHYDQGLPNRVLVEDIGPDVMHPTDAGYFKMGDIFIEHIIEVEKKGWLKPPVDNGVPADGEAARDAEDAIHAAEEKAKAEGKGQEDPGHRDSDRNVHERERRSFGRRHGAV
ncbi:carbohydrate esterase family 3 protein [Durotheca rogersii]|uniref:carbohydrate esterase family 3 protein n=1 Tax=Durotheca rogersii TaxID=419775 RepID=UPI002220B898|nr:carbohydrate esterase family 3 protein [Durotheca rogersii]KAI5864015.1 carbohydrate esterase family 3 protein [Durotheca rogersii]